MNFLTKTSRMLERGLVLSGLLLLGVFVAAYLHRQFTVRAEMKRFQEAQRIESSRQTALQSMNTTDSAAREARQKALLEIDPELTPAMPKGGAGNVSRRNPETPIAVLRIPRLDLEVPVLNGTDRFTLNRGVGRIAGTAFPGETGNMGIAGHRDGFFRGLKDIQAGDKIELITTKGTEVYVVDQTVITDPHDLSVLEPGPKPVLTLVTCYPFHYIGRAPQRFVVEASLQP